MTFYSGNQNRPAFSGTRLVIGAVIALVGIISYFTHTSVNPVTGEKQHITLTAEQETALGLQSAPQMAAEMGGAVDPADPRARFVQEVGQNIAAHSEASRSPYSFDYHLLRDTQAVNAFALPGGQVFITLGLYQKLSDEAALAGVLGHETGHVIGRHAAEQMAQSKLGQSLVLATGVAASGRNSGYTAAAIASFVDQMTQLHFSRSDESEADALGLKYMTESGYDPRAMVDVMNVLAELSKGNRQPQFLVTHPYPEARLAAIQKYLADNPVPSGVGRGRKLPE